MDLQRAYNFAHLLIAVFLLGMIYSTNMRLNYSSETFLQKFVRYLMGVVNSAPPPLPYKKDDFSLKLKTLLYNVSEKMRA